jgi:hypothetical protein
VIDEARPATRLAVTSPFLRYRMKKRNVAVEPRPGDRGRPRPAPRRQPTAQTLRGYMPKFVFDTTEEEWQRFSHVLNMSYVNEGESPENVPLIL